MPELKVLRVFEYERLRIGDRGFEEGHWRALGRWAERQSSKHLEIWPEAVRFLNWVGVIEVDGLAIEILPKLAAPNVLDREPELLHWHRILIELLRAAGQVELRTSDVASLQLQNRTLLDILFSQFLDEMDALLRAGLVKRYRALAKQRTALKGRLDLPATLRRNLAHAERFSTIAFEYDRINRLNLILRSAVDASALYAPTSYSRSRAKNISLEFSEWPQLTISKQDFDAARFDRKTEGYRRAIDLARLILEKDNPDFASGRSRVFSLLFDMNALWEKAILGRLCREARSRPGTRVYSQRSKVFWRSEDGQTKTVRPDIVLDLPASPRIILDTKWKTLADNIPADQDLRQIFVYDTLWDAPAGFLVYPSLGGPKIRQGRYTVQEREVELACSVLSTSCDPSAWRGEFLLDWIEQSALEQR